MRTALYGPMGASRMSTIGKTRGEGGALPLYGFENFDVVFWGDRK